MSDKSSFEPSSFSDSSEFPEFPEFSDYSDYSDSSEFSDYPNPPTKSPSFKLPSHYGEGLGERLGVRVPQELGMASYPSVVSSAESPAYSSHSVILAAFLS